jgi:outer membrane protein OmpA-like peptidoglycan-associated protein
MDDRIQAALLAVFLGLATPAGVHAQTSADDAATHRHLVFFQPASAELTPTGRSVVRSAAEQAAAMKPRLIKVTGYASPLGQVSDTQALSQERANAVAQALIAAGVPRERLSIEAKGETEATPGAGVMDRQVEIELLE